MQNDDICRAWQAQGSGAAPLTLDELRKKGDRFRSTIMWRNLREYVAIAGLVPYFAYFAYTSRQPLMRWGNGLLMAGLLYSAYQLHRRASFSPAPGALGWEDCLAFHRRQLMRQRDAVSSVWRWYIGPLVPGLVTIVAEVCLVAFRKSVFGGGLALVTIAVIALVPWWVARLNRNAAAIIQRQIDALETGETVPESGAPRG